MREILSGRKLQFLSLVLAIALGVSAALNVYQHMVLSGLFNISSGRTLVFLWPPEEQEIVDGTLRIEAAFSWENENLSITVKVNDDEEYYRNDCVGLVLDSNENGQIGWPDAEYVLLTTNEYYEGNECTVDERGISWVEKLPRPSPYHKCTFSSKTGYTFKISFPKETINFHWPMLILLAFQDADPETLMYDCVSVQVGVI